MLEAVCPNGHRLQVPLEHAGMKLRCPAPGCGVIFQLSAHSPSGGTVAVGPGASGPGLPQTAPSPQPPAPPPPPAPAPSQPQSSQTYANVPLSSAPTTTAGDGGRWAGTEPAPGQAAPGTSQSGPQLSAPQITMPPRGRSLDLSGGALLGAAQAILMLGLVLVLAARGCDSLGARNVVRLTAKIAQERQTFEAKVQDELAAEPDAAKKTELGKNHAKQRATQEKSWTTMQNAVNDAASANLIWGYWREMMFVVGTILFSLGLIAVGFVGQGVERYLSFGLLAIIVFSVYIGGAAWFTSIIGGLQGMVPGR